MCEVCMKAFNQKNALIIHQRKHSGEKPHKCAYCDVAFLQKGNLKTHIKRAHHQDMVDSMNLEHDASSISITVDQDKEVDDEQLMQDSSSHGNTLYQTRVSQLLKGSNSDQLTTDTGFDFPVAELFQQ